MNDFTIIRILDNSNELGASGGLSGLGTSGGLTGWGTGTQNTSGGLSSTLPRPQNATGGLSATLPTGSRLVVLKVTAKFNSYDFNAARLAPGIKSKFEFYGWNILSVDIAQDWTYNLTITIKANIFNGYTAENARQQATKILQDIKLDYFGLGAYTYKAFLNLDVKIVSDYQTTTTTGFLGGSSDWTNSGDGSGSSILSPILSSFAGGAGVSTPFALLAGLIILIVILRR